MIVVFDTNVIISGIITEGLCSRLLRRARLREFSLMICPCIFDEIRKILKEKLKASREEILSAFDVINESISEVFDPISIQPICKDKDDDRIIACALAANADYLVTGDADLLEIKRYKSLKILPPKDFELLFE